MSQVTADDLHSIFGGGADGGGAVTADHLHEVFGGGPKRVTADDLHSIFGGARGKSAAEAATAQNRSEPQATTSAPIQPRAPWQQGPDHTEETFGYEGPDQPIPETPPNPSAMADLSTDEIIAKARRRLPQQGSQGAQVAQDAAAYGRAGTPQPMPPEAMPPDVPPRGFVGNLGAGIRESVVENLPPGVQDALPQTVTRGRPAEPGAGRFIGHAIGGVVPNTRHPESLAFGIGAAGAAERAAAPILMHVEEIAGPRIAGILKSAIGGASGSAPMGMIEEAQRDPEEWAHRPAEKLGKVMLAGASAGAAGGIGGAGFGALSGKNRGAGEGAGADQAQADGLTDRPPQEPAEPAANLPPQELPAGGEGQIPGDNAVAHSGEVGGLPTVANEVDRPAVPGPGVDPNLVPVDVRSNELAQSTPPIKGIPNEPTVQQEAVPRDWGAVFEPQKEVIRTEGGPGPGGAGGVDRPQEGQGAAAVRPVDESLSPTPPPSPSPAAGASRPSSLAPEKMSARALRLELEAGGIEIGPGNKKPDLIKAVRDLREQGIEKLAAKAEPASGAPTESTPKTFPHSPEDTPRSEIGKGGPGAAAAGNPDVSTPAEHIGPRGVFARAGSIIDHLTGKTKEAGRFISDKTTIKTLPATVRAAPEAAEHLVTHASAPQVAKIMARRISAEVLGPLEKTPDRVNTLGAMRNEDTLRATRASLQRMAKEATDPETAAELQRKANAVKTLVGTRAFKTEADYEAAWKDPELKAASERWDQFEQHVLTPMHAELRGRVMERGPRGTFTNLLAVDPDNPETVHLKTAQSPGELSTARRKGSVHGVQRTGTGEYSTWAPDMIAHGIGDNLSRVELERGYKALQDAGVAIELPPGEPRPEIDGKPAKKIEVVRKGAHGPDGSVRTDIRNLWVRPDLYNEIKNLTTKRYDFEDGVMARLGSAVTAVQTKLGVDAAYHVVNNIAGIANAPGAKTYFADLARKFPGVNIADAVIDIARHYQDALGTDPAILAEMEKLARAGALRSADAEGFVAKVDTASRLILSRMYDQLVSRGLAKDTPAARREYVNRIGQYNARLQQQWVRFLRTSGVSPFITAGRTFNAMGRRAVGSAAGLDTGGVAPTGRRASVQLRATQFIGTAITLALPAIWNQLQVGNPLGRPGVPAGAIDTGKDYNGKPIYLDPLKWTTLRRGMRITGATAAIEGARNDRTLGQTTTDMIQDTLLGVAHPAGGPSLQVGSMLTTGATIGGFDKAPAAAPGGNKYIERAKAAIGLLNPTAGPLVEGGLRAITEGGVGRQAASGAKEVGKRFAGALGIGAGTPPNDAARNFGEFQEFKRDQRRRARE